MSTTTIADAIGDSNHDDVLAIREEIALQSPDRHATVTTTDPDDAPLAIVDERGRPMTAAAALAEIDRYLEAGRMTATAVTDLAEFNAEAAVNLHDVVVIADAGSVYEVFVNMAELSTRPIWTSDGHFGTLGAALNRARDIVRVDDNDLATVRATL